MAAGSGSTRTIRLRGGRPIHFRPGTTDAATERLIFGLHQFGNPWSTSFRLMRRWYDDMLAAERVPLLIDAGGNIGAASMWFAEQFPAARIVAVEPEPENASLCRANLNGRGDVREEAIGSESGYAQMVDDQVDADAFPFRRSSSGVHISTINSIVEDAGDVDLFIVKVDIEGFESDLFSANTEWIDQAKSVVIEPHDWMMPGQRTSLSFQRVMGTAGFEVHLSGENLVYVRPPGRLPSGAPDT